MQHSAELASILGWTNNSQPKVDDPILDPVLLHLHNNGLFESKPQFYYTIQTHWCWSRVCFVLEIFRLKPCSLSSLLTDSVLPEGGDWGLLLLSPFPLLLPPSLFLLSVLSLRWPLLPPSHLSGFYGCVSLLPAALKCYLFLLFCCFSFLSVIFLWKFCNFIFCLKFLSFLCVFFSVD